MDLMTTLPANRPWNLPALGWIYVGVVGMLAVGSSALNLASAYLAMLVLTLPVGVFYFPLGLALVFFAGPILGLGPGESYWPLAALWVLMWLMLAWTNAKLFHVSSVGHRRWREQRRHGRSANTAVTGGRG